MQKRYDKARQGHEMHGKCVASRAVSRPAGMTVKQNLMASCPRIRCLYVHLPIEKEP